MDEAVIRAMARWPNVPEVFGWLSLDRRGRWCLRGDPITHPGAVAFIGRNYQADDRGRWYFQNGPQRVLVALAYTPWVYRLDGSGCLVTHTGLPVTRVARALTDEEGNLLLVTEHGVGLMEDRDLTTVGSWLKEPETGGGSGGRLRLEMPGACLPVGSIRRVEVPAEFDFEPDPQSVD